MKTPNTDASTDYSVRTQSATTLITVICNQCNRERSGVPQWFGGVAERNTHVHAMRCALRATCTPDIAGESCPQPEV